MQDPQPYAVGVRNVLVNGVEVVRDGQGTAARPGRAVCGAGWTGGPGGGACRPAQP